MAKRLTEKQRQVLEHGASGTCIRFVWHWTIGRDRFSKSVTRDVNTFLKNKLMKAQYYSGGTASATATDAGRELLKKDDDRDRKQRFAEYNRNPQVEE